MKTRIAVVALARPAAMLAGLLLAVAPGSFAQETTLSKNAISVNMPPNSPVTVIRYDSDQSRATAMGAAMRLDLDMVLLLRNASPSHIRGITLRVISQEAVPGGKGSVTKVSLNVSQGEVFPVDIHMQLVRPTQVASGPLVQVDLDGVLFQDLSFYGADKLNSRRYLTACEMEAQRDRAYYKQVLLRSGKEGLKKAMLESLSRQSELPALNVRVGRPNGPSVTSAALPPEHEARFAFLQFPDSPVEPVAGWAHINGNEARAPQIDVLNTSSKPVRYVEFGWLVSDPSGRQYMAAALPSSESALYLPAGSKATVRQDSSLRFSAGGQPLNIEKMTGFVSQVEFVDGKVWVPSRQSLDNPLLQKVLAPSAEELRLSHIYLSKGPDALIEELKKF
ncbi:MAG TPA: hypothetical protein VME43_18670 [Bryobacteraceae bacterium]|nr:hypothetical protein [Bryobacteraceae bacterium]